MVAWQNTFYIFGGLVKGEIVTNRIAAFSTITKEWKKIGQLKYSRGGHGVFIQRENFVVVGGRVQHEKTMTRDNHYDNTRQDKKSLIVMPNPGRRHKLFGRLL